MNQVQVELINNTVEIEPYTNSVEVELVPVKTVQLGLMGLMPIQGVKLDVND